MHKCAFATISFSDRGSNAVTSNEGRWPHRAAALNVIGQSTNIFENLCGMLT